MKNLNPETLKIIVVVIKAVLLILIVIGYIFLIMSCNPDEKCASDLEDAKEEIELLVNNSNEYLSTVFRLDLEKDSITALYDSVLKTQPRDTVWKIPQCTLCYERIDSVNGVQYYVGYDGVYYKVYQSGDTLKKVVFRDTIIDLFMGPHERSLITVRAKGTICEEEYPELKVYVNGDIVQIIEVDSEEYKDYEFNARFHLYDIDSIQVFYDNDYSCGNIGEDRNAWVSNIRVNDLDWLNPDSAKIKGFINWHNGTNTVAMPSNGTITIYIDGYDRDKD